MIGTKIAHYEITDKLGEGGMGVVYKARDTSLDRYVALKLLPADKLASSERKQRFVQEAKAASALNHPHIVTIYEISQEGGNDFISMEYVAGKTLDALIPRNGMRLGEALKQAVQIADALAAAHAAGIVHRDLKPSNIIVGDDGRVRVLDFGLAKLVEQPLHASPEAPTVTAAQAAPVTGEGAVLGTPNYMSPEQAQGLPIDARSDIFSFGAVLYEMLTGRRAFQGDSPVTTMAAIVQEEPEALPSDIPHELRKLVRRCLRKGTERRAHNMVDLKLALQELKEESDSGSLPDARIVSATTRNRRIPILTAILIVVVAAAVLWTWQNRTADSVDTSDAQLVPVPLTSYPGVETHPSFSPDGSQVAFAWNGGDSENFDIYVTVVGTGTRSRLTRNSARDVAPAWSPDGSSIAFVRSTGNIDHVYSVSPLGGPERLLIELNFAGNAYSNISWSPDGKVLAIPHKSAPNAPAQIGLLSVDTGQFRSLTQPPPDSNGDLMGAFSPDGSRFAFVRWHSFSVADVFVVGLDGVGAKQITHLGKRIAGLAWASSGSELLFTPEQPDTEVWRVDSAGGNLRSAIGFSRGARSLAVAGSRNRLVYELRQPERRDIWKIPLEPAKTDEGPVELIASTRNDGQPQVSPDGSRIAFTSERSGYREIWVGDHDGSDVVQLTNMKASAGGTPRWSPDGKQIAFNSVAEGNLQIYVVPSAGGVPRALTSGTSVAGRPAWSADGNWVYFFSNRGGDVAVWKVASEGGEPEQVTSRGTGSPKLSPDGRYLYFSKSDDLSVWRKPVGGGAEEPFVAVEGLGGSGCYEPLEDGFYFLARRQGEVTLQRADYTTRQPTTLVVLENASEFVNCFSISPDRGWLVYGRTGTIDQDLMLVEGFR